MEIKIKTKGFKETLNVYSLAKAVFHHLNDEDENVEVSYDAHILDDTEEAYVSITFEDYTYAHNVKVYDLIKLINDFTETEV